jgi:hypothetical protein
MSNPHPVTSWVPGVSGNPNGRPKLNKRFIDRITQRMEFRQAFLRLIQIRDGRIMEMDFTSNGKRIWVYPSVSNLIAACVKIMEYTAGKPEQKISLDVINGENIQPNALQLILNRPGNDGAIRDDERPSILLSTDVSQNPQHDNSQQNQEDKTLTKLGEVKE